MPAPQASLTFSAGVEALRRIEEARSEREARMRNALEILAGTETNHYENASRLGSFVRATAREGLGREPT